MMELEFEWDENKNAINITKHRIDFDDAIWIFEGFVFEKIDTRKDYGEVRWVAFGECNQEILCVVYTNRNDAKRIISARKANNYERREYYKKKPQ